MDKLKALLMMAGARGAPILEKLKAGGLEAGGKLGRYIEANPKTSALVSGAGGLSAGSLMGGDDEDELDDDDYAKLLMALQHRGA